LDGRTASTWVDEMQKLLLIEQNRMSQVVFFQVKELFKVHFVFPKALSKTQL